jgi:hypothetical protein
LTSVVRSQKLPIPLPEFREFARDVKRAKEIGIDKDITKLPKPNVITEAVANSAGPLNGAQPPNVAAEK